MAIERPSADETREQSIIDVLVHLADSLVQDFDADELLHELVIACVEHLDADAAGVMLADASGNMRAAAGSSREMHQLEILEIAAGEGPSAEAYRRCEEVVVRDLRTAHERWPSLTARAMKMGFVAGYGFPLRLRQRTIGALNLFQSEARRPLEEPDLRAARGFAAMATIVLLQDEKHERAGERVLQLEHALQSRVVVEQAKGILAERLSVPPGEAFQRLRQHARDHNRKVRDVAQDIVEGRLSL